MGAAGRSEADRCIARFCFYIRRATMSAEIRRPRHHRGNATLYAHAHELSMQISILVITITQSAALIACCEMRETYRGGIQENSTCTPEFSRSRPPRSLMLA